MLQAPGTVSARLMIGSDLKQSVIQDEVSSESSFIWHLCTYFLISYKQQLEAVSDTG